MITIRKVYKNVMNKKICPKFFTKNKNLEHKRDISNYTSYIGNDKFLF